MRMFAALAALALAAVPVAVPAQSSPGGLPSYAVPASPSDQETIHGHIASIDDAYNLQVSDDRGFIDSVQLGQGTIVTPSGTQLQPGMIVTIAGVSRGSVFAADRIEVAGAMTAPAPPPPPVAPAGPPPVQLPPGAQLMGTLATTLDSKNAFAGEDVVLTNVASSDGSISGATLFGTVTDVTRPGEGRNAQVRIHFDSLRLPDRRTAPVDGIVLSMTVKTKSNAAKELGGALLGMLAGNAIGKTLFGVSGGGVVGAIGGFMVAKDNRSDVVIPADTTVTVQLLNARRQAL